MRHWSAVLLPLLVAAALSCGAGAARAHLASDSYLRVELTEDQISGQWDIALRDLDVAVGLDDDGDGEITWGELRRKRAAIEAYAFARLHLAAPGGACRLAPTELLVDRHAGSAYAVLRFAAACPAGASTLSLDYRLLFDIDPTHRGLLTIARAGTVQSDVLSPAHPSVEIAAVPGSLASEAVHFLRFGFDHIVEGYDHLLFIAVLLIMAPLRRTRGGAWLPVDSLGASLLETVKILTAFTLAHATTLTLAVLGLVEVPSRLVETAVAATIVATAADNLRPLLPRLRWTIAFLFGLVHGLAFATALGPMQLPAARLALALAAFNLGIEAGQVTLALVVVPVVFWFRRRPAYRAVVAPALSIAALVVALLWLVDRAFVLGLVPGGAEAGGP